MTRPIPPCRLSIVFASEAEVAVVLRRGPSRWVEVVLWDAAKDRFEPGHWLHGRIFPERCGLSPNGKLFVYFAAKHGMVDKSRGYQDTYTAVSKPPYLTALAMWPEGSTWGGGGRFIDNRTLRLAYGARGTRPPHGRTQLYMAPLPPHHPNHAPTGLTIEADLDHYETKNRFRSEMTITGADWVGQDHAGGTVFCRRGTLFRLSRRGSEMMLRDFNADTPREVISPAWAQRW